MKIAVIGAGSWGTALAQVLAGNGHDVGPVSYTHLDVYKRQAPILPMTVRNAENVKRKGERLRFPKITIEYGNPLLVEDFDFLPKEDRLEGCTWYAMRECFALSLRVPREQVDMPALFPGGRDFTAVFEEHPVPEHTTAEVVAGIRAKRAAKAGVSAVPAGERS